MRLWAQFVFACCLVALLAETCQCACVIRRDGDCPAEPQLANSQFRDDYGEKYLASLLEQGCLNRAEDYHVYCGNTGTTSATFQTTGAARHLGVYCEITRNGSCPVEEELANRSFRDIWGEENRDARTEKGCFARAEEIQCYCGGTGSTEAFFGGTSDSTTSTKSDCPFMVRGVVKYQRVLRSENKNELDFETIEELPARRIVVVAKVDGEDYQQTTTKDDGSYVIMVEEGKSITLEVHSITVASKLVPDDIGDNDCNGASFRVVVVDNKGSKDFSDDSAYYTYAFNGGEEITAETASSEIDLVLRTIKSEVEYIREAAPFAILDTIIDVFERVCQAAPDQEFPELIVNWSEENSPQTIGTSFYTQSQLFILGHPTLDSDEFDVAVIAHETGHYLEDKLFRSDSLGGQHGTDDILEASVAFGEGWANALGASLTREQGLYWDQVPGEEGLVEDFRKLRVAKKLSGHFSETCVAYIIYQLFTIRGSWDRLFTVFQEVQKTTPELTTLLSFVHGYFSLYGSEDNLKEIVDSCLPYNLIVKDSLDSGNNLGTFYSKSRVYPPEDGNKQEAEFWTQYRQLVVGNNEVDTFIPYSTQPYNKYGVAKSFHFVANESSYVLIAPSAECVMTWDLSVHQSGQITNAEAADSIAFKATAGEQYFIRISTETIENSCSGTIKVSLSDDKSSVKRALKPKSASVRRASIPTLQTMQNVRGTRTPWLAWK